MQSNKDTVGALAIKAEAEASLRTVLNLQRLRNWIFLWVHFDHFTYVFSYIKENLFALLA